MPPSTLKIKTLSPVHIGDGGVYDGMTLLEVEKDFYPLNYNMLVSAFETYNIPFKKFKDWVVDSKGLRFQRKPKINDFIKEAYPENYQQIINTLISYNPHKLDNICLVRPNTDIETCLKDSSNHPYIPGSEIKGAIVTAILSQFLQNDDNLYNDLCEILEKYSPFLDQVYESMKLIKELTKQKKRTGFEFFRKLDIPRNDWGKIRRIFSMRERPIEMIAKDLQNDMRYPQNEVDRIINVVQQWRGEKREYNQRIWTEQKRYDKNRIKRISDEVKFVEKKIVDEIYLIEKKYQEKYLSINNGKSPIGAKLMRFLHISDTIPANKTKIATCMIVHRDSNITMNLFYEIIDTNSSFHSKFKIEKEDIYLNSLGFSDSSKNALDNEFILKCIYDFSNEILKEDINYFASLNGRYRFPVNEVQDHLVYLKSQNTEKSPLLRIGKGQGFLSLTLATLIKKFDREKHNNIYGKLLGVIQSEKNNPENYPITRRLIIDGKENYKLPGWIKLTFEEKLE